MVVVYLFPWVGSSKAWIISPIQGRIIGTICPGVYFPPLTHPLPAATLSLLPEKGKKRQTNFKEFGHSAISQKCRMGGSVFSWGFPCVFCHWLHQRDLFDLFSHVSSFLVNPFILFEIISSGGIPCYHSAFPFFSPPQYEKQTAGHAVFVLLECCLVGWRSSCSRETFWTALHLPTHPLVLFSSGSVVTKVTAKVCHSLTVTSDIFLSGLILWGRKKELRRLGALRLFLGTFFSDHYFQRLLSFLVFESSDIFVVNLVAIRRVAGSERH